MYFKKALYFFLTHFPNIGLIRFLVTLKKPLFLVRFWIKFYFVRCLKVNLNEIEKPIEEYRSFLDFFTRQLKTGARKIKINPKKLLSPVDARVLDYGKIDSNKLIQAKGKDYSLEALVGSKLAKIYRNGDYLTLYLSPKDYHRIHHPSSGKIDEVFYFPGTLFPVNPFSLAHFNRVFSSNKRLIISYQTETISYLSCWIGALNVGELKIFFDSQFYTSAQEGYDQSTQQNYRHKFYDQPVEQGGQAGCFELGSTVILVFPPDQIELIFKNPTVLLGEEIARLLV